jgi:hypothetical protein
VLVHRLPADLQCCTASRSGRNPLMSNCGYLRSVYPSPPAIRHAASTMGVLLKHLLSPRNLATSVRRYERGRDGVLDQAGAVWPHDDGKGFNVNLVAVPLISKLVIRDRCQPRDIAAVA